MILRVHACQVTDDVLITVEQGATVNAGTDTPICSGTTYTLTGSSIGGSATNGTWSIVSQPVAPPAAGDGVLSVTTATTTPATVTFKATVAGTYTLRLTTDDPTGSCGAVTDDVVITVGGVATVNAGLDNDICAVMFRHLQDRSSADLPQKCYLDHHKWANRATAPAMVCLVLQQRLRRQIR